ncbi:TPA: hypothetical protein HA361_03995 [Candidatus Woesearchaeota archaeon]|nr:hypothetical protein [Candidatus Woesearchaeota archaeon]HII68526.1 hypothetical protein [Candidatus Woesearchaeota archaeon]
MESERDVLDVFALKFAGITGKYGNYIIVSGFVAIASGRTRGTEDIDMIMERISRETFRKLHADLVKNGFLCFQGDSADMLYDEYLAQNNSLRYAEDGETLPQMEMKLAKDPLDAYQLKTRIKLKFTGLGLWFSNINVNIAFKEHYLKSPKDMEDAKHLRIVYKEMVSEEEIRAVIRLIDRYRP